MNVYSKALYIKVSHEKSRVSCTLLSLKFYIIYIMRLVPVFIPIIRKLVCLSGISLDYLSRLYTRRIIYKTDNASLYHRVHTINRRFSHLKILYSNCCAALVIRLSFLTELYIPVITSLCKFLE